MKKIIDQLKRQGFRVDGFNGNAVRMSRGSDHRVILPNGTMKRGKPDYKNYH